MTENQLYKTYSRIFNKDMIVLMPGEYVVSSDKIISTILGTCISVILYSHEHKTGGMNHFMLPNKSTTRSKSAFHDLPGRFGLNAMELLINDLIKLGIKKSSLNAKIFGGGLMLNLLNEDSINIGQKNIEFILSFLKDEKINVIANDTGGEGGRKIFFTPWDGKVFVKRMGKIKDPIESVSAYNYKLENNKQLKTF